MCESGYTIQRSCRYYKIQTYELYKYMNPIQRQKIWWAKALSKKQQTVPKYFVKHTYVVSKHYAHF